MKSLSTALAQRAMAKQEMPADPLAPARASASDELGVEVIDAALFTRQHNEVARRFAGSASFGGPLARMAMKKVEQSRAGGLPEHFLLAITRDEVVALERKVTTGTRDGIGEPRGEVGRWRRADLEVSVKDKGYLLHVTLAPTTGEETVNCSTTKFAASEAFVVLLQSGAANAAASA
jgi:hypothetical protein